jgi:hypothetical protein
VVAAYISAAFPEVPAVLSSAMARGRGPPCRAAGSRAVEEQSLRASIPMLTPIADDVSALVRQQYEENPYPRWTATSSSPCGSRRRQHSHSIPHAAFAPRQVHVEILIAGCEWAACD